MPLSSSRHPHSRWSREVRLAVALFATAGLSTPMLAHGALHERMRALMITIEVHPQDAAAHLELARLCCQHGDWNLALTLANAADELQPHGPDTDLVRGEALLGRRQPREAVASLDRFIAVRTGDARAHLLRARALSLVGGAKSALADFRVAAETGPDGAREAAVAFTREGCDAEARQILAAAIERFGPDPSLLADALELESTAGLWTTALTRLAALQACAPRPEPWMARRAELLTRAGRLPEARAAWKTLLSHIGSLPNLDRGTPLLSELVTRAHSALESLPP